jgi:arylsulfatase
MNRMVSFAALGIVGGTLTALLAQGQEVLPRPEKPFGGKIGLTYRDSTPEFPQNPKAPPGAPNILLILTDDVGFGASSTFGGPIATPTLDRLAQDGLRFNRFHTCALCSPTRAALLTGRNHHSAGSGVITEIGTGYPGYSSVIPKSCATIGEILRQNGYSTSWFGKCHNVPVWETSQAGPFDRWPTGLGFEYFYGFLGGDTNQWDPSLYEGTKPVEKPRGDKDYHLDRDLADHAIAWIRNVNAVAPNKPFFAFYATGTAHAPHHAPKDWIAKYQGQFDQGWDKVREEIFERQRKLGVIPADAKLTPRPGAIPAWDSLTPERQKLYAHMAAVYAAALSHADYHAGRVINAIKQLGKLDNTLIIYIQGDNGASAEGTLQGLLNEASVFNGAQEDFKELVRRSDELGGPTTFNHYPVGWAHAFDTPYQWTKQIASHFGGSRNGAVISWPKRIKAKGEIRPQFHHVIDIAPTILEVAGLREPKSVNGVPQKPIEGVSLAYTFNDAKAPDRHTTQYFELVGNRAIYHDGWVAATTPQRLPWVLSATSFTPPELYPWELYHVADDWTEAEDVATKYPEKLKELQKLWLAEAAKYNVLPLDNRLVERYFASRHPSTIDGVATFTFFPGDVRIPAAVAPDLRNRSFRITARVEIPPAGAEGMLVTNGGRFGGYGLYLQEGKLVYLYNVLDSARYKVATPEKIASGKHVLVLDFKYDGWGLGKGGTVTFLVDGKKAGQGHIERTTPLGGGFTETFDVGEDTGTPVDESYAAKLPFRFSGKLEKVTVELKPAKLLAEDQKKLRKAEQQAAAVRE